MIVCRRVNNRDEQAPASGGCAIWGGYMGRIIAVTNQKGGVGKTTTSVNLTASLAAMKRRVMLVDLDPQGNATMGCGIDKEGLTRSACELLLGEVSLDQALVRPEGLGFALLPANSDLTAAEVKLTQQAHSEMCLRELLVDVRDDYDYIVIDCPPALNMLTINALTAAAGVLIPMQCEYYALEGLTALLGTVDQIRRSLNPDLHVEGLLRTMYDGRNRLAREVAGQLIEHFGERVYNTVVPRNVRLAEAPSHGRPVLYYDKGSPGSLAYLALAGEMIRRHAPAQTVE